MIRGEFLPHGLRDGRAKLHERAPVVCERARRGVALKFEVMEKIVGEAIALRAFQSDARLAGEALDGEQESSQENDMLNLNLIRERAGKGFRPFRLHLSDGRKYDIPHADFFAVGRGYVIVIRDDGLDDRIDALHIVSMEDIDFAKPRRRKRSA
jgi:hypothetical protein